MVKGKLKLRTEELSITQELNMSLPCLLLRELWQELMFQWHPGLSWFNSSLNRKEQCRVHQEIDKMYEVNLCVNDRSSVE